VLRDKALWVTGLVSKVNAYTIPTTVNIVKLDDVVGSAFHNEVVVVLCIGMHGTETGMETFA